MLVLILTNGTLFSNPIVVYPGRCFSLVSPTLRWPFLLSRSHLSGPLYRAYIERRSHLHQHRPVPDVEARNTFILHYSIVCIFALECVKAN